MDVKHPDIFTADEAASYLHLDSAEQLEPLRREFELVGHRPVGKGFMYWRDDLDRTAKLMFGREQKTVPQLRIAGGRR